MSGALLYGTAAGLCAGIALALLFGLNVLFFIVCLCAAIIFLFVGKKYPKFLLLAAALAAGTLGFVRADFFLSSEAQQTLPNYIGQTQSIEGVVSDDPDKRASSLRITITAEKVGGQPASGTFIAVLPRETSVAYGDRVVVRGPLEVPQVFMTNTERLFDYPGYLRVRGVSALMQKTTLISSTAGSASLMGGLLALKHAFEASLERIVPEPDVSLLEGILLGERRGLPAALLAAFVVANLIHIVVLSGYNISIISEAVLRATRTLPRLASYATGIIFMVLFICMTGGGSTSLRAGVMALIAITARYFHRSSVALRSLAVAAAALALLNPLVLLFDPSFILSILATFGLITIAPFVEARLPRALARYPQTRSIVASTIAVQIFVLPALLYFTGILSFIALPANVAVLLVVPFAMLGGFAAGVLNVVHPALAFVPALLADVLLKWMIWVATIAAALPFASTAVPAFPAWLAVLVYLPLTAWAIALYRKSASHIPTS